MKLIFLLLSAVFASGGGDWSERGNGGDVIACPDSGHYVMLDLYEAHQRYMFVTSYPMIWNPEMPGYVVGPRELISMAEEKLEYALSKHDPDLLGHLLNLLLEYDDDVHYLPGTSLRDIEDAGDFWTPWSCRLEQLAIQRTPLSPHDKRYIVSLDLWKKMKTESRLAAILHEIIYNYALKLNPGLKNSEKVRYFNALILADKIRDMTTEEYKKTYSDVFGIKI
jgi:hypothetical protein